jgi:hypothetical protein
MSISGSGVFRREIWLWLSAILLLRLLCWVGLNGAEDCSYVLQIGGLNTSNAPAFLASPQGGRLVWTGWLVICRTLAGIHGLSSGWVSLPGVLLLAWLAARWGIALGGPAAARMALLVTAVYPLLSVFGTLAYSEALCAALLGLSATLLLLPGDRPCPPTRAWTAGWVGGLAFLCHETALVPLLLLPLATRRPLRPLLAFGAGLLVAGLGDWAFGTWLTGDPLHRLHASAEITSSAHRAWYPTRTEVLRRILVDWWRPYVSPWAKDFLLDAGTTGMAIAGWLLAWRRGQTLLCRIGLWWALTLVALDLLPASLHPYLPALDAANPRHRLPMALPCILLAAHALHGAWALRRGRLIAPCFLALSLGAGFLLAVETRQSLTPSVQAARVLLAEREGPRASAPVWTDAMSARVLRVLLPEGMRSRVHTLSAEAGKTPVHGLILWDPLRWKEGASPAQALGDGQVLTPVAILDARPGRAMERWLGLVAGYAPPLVPAELYAVPAPKP